VSAVSDTVWTAAELAALTPAEDQALFDASVVTDLDQVPPEFLARVRSQLEAETARRGMRNAS
jgi:hypothetical protein